MKRIVLIDDNQTHLTLLWHLVRKIAGYQAANFTKPKEALAWCLENEAELIIANYLMPEMDGIEFVIQLRQSPQNVSVPVILVITNEQTGFRQKALEAGTSDFINKPIDKTEFMLRVKNTLALRSSEKKLDNQTSWLKEEVLKATEEVLDREQEIIYRLTKAAEYLIDNIAADDLADKLINNDFSDSAKRDLAFALGLSGHSDAENYLVDTLSSLSDSSSVGMNSDLQKVRLMVALSGSGQVSEYGFQALDSLAKDPNESSNVRNNALINLGSTLQQMQNQGQAPAGLADQLISTLNQAIGGENSASAILAAGNAKLDNLDQQIMSKLSSSNSKERYAAATVLARNPDYNDDLIQHLSSEPSDLVNYAILSNLDATNLSRQQKDRLLDSSSDTSPDITKVIHQLIQ